MCKPDSFKIVATLARVSLILIALGPTQYSASLAQAAKSGPITVSEVSARSSSNGTVVSIAADGPLSRAQTWQDREGYHVVVPSGAAPKEIKVGKGIKVIQLDHTLEILVQTKPGASVTVQPSSNHLNLTIEGQLEPRMSADDSKKTSSSSALVTDSGLPAEMERKANDSKESGFAESKTGSASYPGSSADPTYISQLQANSSPVSALSQSGSSEEGTGAADSLANQLLEFLTSTAFIVILVISVVCLLVLRWRESRTGVEILANDRDEFGFSDFDAIEIEDDLEDESGLIKSNGSYGSNGASAQRKSVARLPVSMPAALFGAFQVDREVAKLVMDQPHKMEVLASRALDDRRAIEASLLKALASTDEDERRRVRAALEEYGFVARQNAAVLLAPDPYDRTSAARMLGDIKSPSALPFLLEALYDNESIVRNQAVLSIGELRLPSAIGALLDIARKHADVPGALLSRALSACSVEGLGLFDDPIPEPRLLSTTDIELFSYEVRKLKPASAVQELPESVDDERFAEALAKIESLEITERAEGIKLLAQFAVRESVATLAQVARRDAKANLRALAIAGLATINHESVFPSMLIGMADESREVRAAAARSLSRLSFDRADAYVRVMETDDAATLRDVAQACVKAGVASQAIDRLGSTDRRQGCEALSLVSLLAKADVLEPIMAAIENHPSVDVRVSAVRLLGAIGHPTVLEELKEIPAERMPDDVQTALAETIAELEVARNKDNAVTETEAVTEPLELPSSESLSEPDELEGTEFVTGQDELLSDEIDPEQDELKSAESVSEQNELDGVDCQWIPEPLEPKTLEFQRDEPQPNCFEFVSEQPPGDTSGLPAPPIA